MKPEFVYLLVGMIAVFGAWQFGRLLNPAVRDRRRRSRNYGRVISHRHRPAVRLAVKVARS